MPVVFGSKKVANFWTYSYPATGSLLLGVFTMGVWAMTLAILFRGRKGRV